MTELIRWYDPRVRKKVKLLKILKYFEKLLPMETCTYFGSIEIKVLLTDQKNLSIEETAQQATLGKRIYENPIHQMDRNIKLIKYDKVRKLKALKVTAGNGRNRRRLNSTSCASRRWTRSK